MKLSCSSCFATQMILFLLANISGFVHLKQANAFSGRFCHTNKTPVFQNPAVDRRARLYCRQQRRNAVQRHDKCGKRLNTQI
jgi:hypothetical protein